MNSKELWNKVHELEKQILTVNLISEQEASGKTVKNVYHYWVDHKCYVFIVFEDNTALWFDGDYFCTSIILWRDYSCSDGIVVYKSEWLEVILDDTPEFVDLAALEECVATVKLARETQWREELERTIGLKEKELENLKSKLERK